MRSSVVLIRQARNPPLPVRPYNHPSLARTQISAPSMVRDSTWPASRRLYVSALSNKTFHLIHISIRFHKYYALHPQHNNGQSFHSSAAALSSLGRVSGVGPIIKSNSVRITASNSVDSGDKEGTSGKRLTAAYTITVSVLKTRQQNTLRAQ